MSVVSSDVFGTLPDGRLVHRFTLRSDSVRLSVLSLGGIITSLETRDRQGELADIVLGFDHLQGYINKHPYFGAVVGRVANRIAEGKFSIDGKEYQLPINNGPNSLHGGLKGFDKMLWTSEILSNGVRLSMTSADGEEGYPGELKVWVTYSLDGAVLAINYKAQTTKTTPVNLTNHSYFNLAGHVKKLVLSNEQRGQHNNAIVMHVLYGVSINKEILYHGFPNIYDHEVSIEAENYLPVDKTSIPTGEITSVENTNFDLRNLVVLGDQIANKLAGGFDHNFCLNFSKQRSPCARDNIVWSWRSTAGQTASEEQEKLLFWGLPPAKWQAPGDRDHPARSSVLHCEFPGWESEGQRRGHIPQAFSFLFGNSELA
ncbi:aldose 1-epimerase isoform X2 [Stegostoma tigrinum]|uniref:aldose 1-epimerase isoform X2 n=1 Tax=Stegostoma tigrinum TaxID=3053191 RepID=UPI00202B4DD3|nr:aldose 1-epimerase isoform X2 [Stegostoma tigrinum]